MKLRQRRFKNRNTKFNVLCMMPNSIIETIGIFIITSLFAYRVIGSPIQNATTTETTTTETTTTTATANATAPIYKLSDYDEDSLYIRDILRAARAAEIQSYLNENIDPCSDFYQFACANFPKFHPSRNGASSNRLQIMAEAFKEKVETILFSSTNRANETQYTIYDKVRTFYKSCMNVKHIAGSYKTKLLSIIAEFGKMPALSGNVNWNESEFDWIAMVAKMQRQYGKSALLRLDIAQDFRDNRINCLYIGQPKLLLPTKAMYFERMTTVYRLGAEAVIAEKLEIYLDVPRKLARGIAAEIMALEVLLARGMWDGKSETEPMNLPTSSVYLNKKYAPVIDIQRFVNLSLGVNQTNCMYERVESFQSNLKSFLTQVPKYVVANYLFYMLLNDEFLLRLENNEKDQKNLCMSKVNRYFSKILDHMVYHQSKSENLENDLRMMFNSLRETLMKKFINDELEWMKPKARYSAIEKLNEMRFEINLTDLDKLSKEFNELQVNETDYLENVKNLLSLKGKQFVARLGETPKPTDASQLYSFTPVNSIQENLIRMPVAVLQPKLLWAKVYPNAIKFGNIGAVLGHEILHGFDDEGRKFDKHGNHYNWWDLDSILAFNERKKCFIDQYNKYRYGSSYLRGDVVLSENIADNGGVKLAFNAYMRWFNDSNRTSHEIERESFPNLIYNNKQLFFISFAQFWCNDVDKIFKDLDVATDSHSPNMFRVIGSLANLQEFAETFKCPNGTWMNPEKKCNLY